jgi:hypothetical protein
VNRIETAEMLTQENTAVKVCRLLPLQCCYKADIQATFKVQLTEPGRPPAEVVTEAPLLFTFGSGLAASLRVPEKRLVRHHVCLPAHHVPVVLVTAGGVCL